MSGLDGMKTQSKRMGSGDAARREVTLGLVQMAMGDDREANVSKAVAMVGEASKKGASIVCLPELFAYRYFPQEKGAEVSPEPVPGPTTRRLSEAARESKVTLVGGSLYEKARDGRLYNTSVVFDERGRMLGKYRKVQIPEDESFYEKDYFSSGSDYQVFKTRPANLGVLICFDQWYPEPARVEKLTGAEVLFYPTAIGRVDGIEESGGRLEGSLGGGPARARDSQQHGGGGRQPRREGGADELLGRVLRLRPVREGPREGGRKGAGASWPRATSS